MKLWRTLRVSRLEVQQISPTMWMGLSRPVEALRAKTGVPRARNLASRQQHGRIDIRLKTSTLPESPVCGWPVLQFQTGKPDEHSSQFLKIHLSFSLSVSLTYTP